MVLEWHKTCTSLNSVFNEEYISQLVKRQNTYPAALVVFTVHTWSLVPEHSHISSVHTWHDNDGNRYHWWPLGGSNTTISSQNTKWTPYTETGCAFIKRCDNLLLHNTVFPGNSLCYRVLNWEIYSADLLNLQFWLFLHIPPLNKLLELCWKCFLCERSSRSDSRKDYLYFRWDWSDTKESVSNTYWSKSANVSTNSLYFPFSKCFMEMMMI